MDERYEAIVIGGGPAGLNAALILGRCRRRTLLCDSGQYRNKKAHALHCFLSRDGIAPLELLDCAREQLGAYGSIEIIHAEVDRIMRAQRGFTVHTSDAVLHAQTVLVATGVIDELPKIKGIHALFGRSVHVCPYCDGWEHRDAPVAAYGKGNKGVGLALLLRQWTHDLVLCTDGPADITGEDLSKLRERGIGVCESRIEGLEGDDGCLRHVVFADGTALPRRALFFNTDQHPRSTLLQELGCRYAEKGIECDEHGQTSIPGVYVAGDVSRDVQLAIIAAAEGARAALAINRRLVDEAR